MISQDDICRVISDSKIGIDNQCIGLAEALGLQPVAGLVQPFPDSLPEWTYMPLDETAHAAGVVKSILARKLPV